MISSLIGSKALRDLQVFASAFETVMAGFKRRATVVEKLLASPATAFIIVASPHKATLDEARFFVDQLKSRNTTPRGVVVNRVAEAMSLSPESEKALEQAPEAYAWWRTAYSTWCAQRARIMRAIPMSLPITLARTLEREVTDLDAVRELGSVLLSGARLPEEDKGPILDI